MQACAQQTNDVPTECWESQGFSIYKKLVEEEFDEVMEAIENKDIKNLTQELVDLIVVSLGLAHTMGLPMQAMWDEVARANASKVDPVTGKVTRREDGKILKGPSFVPVDIDSVFASNLVGPADC
jgi:NTP pyrophosphatase (non-canonical NTP hydrolase)